MFLYKKATLRSFSYRMYVSDEEPGLGRGGKYKGKTHQLLGPQHEYHGHLFFLENGFLSRTCHCILDQASELARRVGGRLL